MFKQQLSRYVSTVCCLLAIFAATVSAQTVAPEYAARLAKIEERFEKRRAELGIPGASIVIVKDDKIIFLKGFGYKDFEKKIAVTPETEFEIGSATKAFTALSVLMQQDAGKLALEDNPKKHLPYFKINDADIDKNITIRDLLSHASGLNRTDLAMVTGKLNREELIKVAGEAKPTAKLREKFQYQNIMFAAAGEIVAQTAKTSWEDFVAKNIFAPLKMNNSNLTVAAMQRAKDFSFGYEYNADTKETKRLPLRDISATAPAGAINSSAADMANWLRFMMNDGKLPDSERLVSESGFAELTKPQMKIGGKTNYGFGWFLQDWNGAKVVQHGGNIDGFNSMVAMIPEKKIGFVVLTNVTASPLPAEMMNVVWENLLGKPAPETISGNGGTAAPSVAASATDAGEKIAADKIIGQYKLKEAGFNIEITSKDGKLLMNVPAQPQYTLEAVAGNKYKMTTLPDGFFATFRPVAKDSKDLEMFLEQPGKTFVLQRANQAAADSTKKAANYAQYVGTYQFKDQPDAKAEIELKENVLTVTPAGQSTLAMIERGADAFGLNGLPESYKLTFNRNADNSIKSVTFNQPNGNFEAIKINETSAASKLTITVDELMTKVIAAQGGEANLRKITSSVVKFDLDLVHQGVKGNGVAYRKAPNKTATDSTFTALGKPIGTSFDYFDGANGGEGTSFTEFEKYTGKRLEDARLSSDLYDLLDWRANYPKATLKPMTKINGNEAFVIVLEPAKGNRQTLYFDAKTFLTIKKESFISSSTSGVDLPYSETYSDYRSVDGVMTPFRVVNSNIANGDIVTVIKEVKNNVPVNDNVFSRKSN